MDQSCIMHVVDPLLSLFRKKSIQENKKCDHCDASACVISKKLRHCMCGVCNTRLRHNSEMDDPCCNSLISWKLTRAFPCESFFNILLGIRVCVRNPTSSWVRQFYTFNHRQCSACIWPAAQNFALRWSSRGRFCCIVFARQLKRNQQH